MKQLIKTMISIGITAITFSSFSLSAQAQQRWSGQGEIIDGDNKGALVELEVIIDKKGETATVQSYPSAGEEITLKHTTETKTGTWQIYPCNDELCATLEQKKPSRTIYYRLFSN